MKEAVLRGAFVSLKTMADGTPRIVLDLDCNLADVAGMGFSPGAQIAVAMLTNEAANNHATMDAVETYGHHYTALYRAGWFYNPLVCDAFVVSRDLPPEEKQKQIKQKLYSMFGVESLSDINPYNFSTRMRSIGIHHTLPTTLKF